LIDLIFKDSIKLDYNDAFFTVVAKTLKKQIKVYFLKNSELLNSTLKTYGEKQEEDSIMLIFDSIKEHFVPLLSIDFVKTLKTTENKKDSKFLE